MFSALQVRSRELLVEEFGQDLVEYALLTAFIGLSSLAALNLLAQSIGLAFVTWDTNVNNAWEPPAPSGS
jgi:Flp pilus assembly pilin Flp